MPSSWKKRFSPSVKKAILFDVSGTLVDQDRTLEYCFNHALGELTSRWSANLADWNPLSVKDRYMAEWRRRRGTLLRAKDKSAVRIACLTYALKPYPLQVTPAFARAFFSELLSLQSREAVAMPGVPGVISALAGRYRLAILSNGFRTAPEHMLAKLGLSACIPSSHVYTPKQTGYRKPSVRAFLSVCESIGVKPEQTVMVGDSWRNDIAGAARAGLDAVWLHPSAGKKIALRKAGSQKIVIVRKLEQLLTFM